MSWFRIALIVVLPGLAVAEADGPDFYQVSGVRDGSVLNLRTAPDRDAPRLARIPAGTDGLPNGGCVGGLSFAEWEKADDAAREAGRKTRWCKTRYNGVEGWVAGWFLTEGSGGS